MIIAMMKKRMEAPKISEKMKTFEAIKFFLLSWSDLFEHISNSRESFSLVFGFVLTLNSNNKIEESREIH